MEEVSEPIADFKVSVGASECGYKPAAVTDDRCCYLEKGHRGIHPLRAPKEKNYNSVLSKETLIFQREELTEKNERLRKCNDKIYQELAELRNVHQRNGVLQADNLALLARIEHLEGHIEVLKLEAAPSAAAAAKPKSTIKIYCQNDEDI
jgi:primosomal protein N''